MFRKLSKSTLFITTMLCLLAIVPIATTQEDTPAVPQAAPPLPIQSSPTGGASFDTTTITFEWVSGDEQLSASHYQLYVAPAANPASPIHTRWYATSELTLLDQTYWVDVDLSGNSGNFIWNIRAYGDDGSGGGAGITGWVGPAAFTINPTPTPIPDSPTGGTALNQNNITFAWVSGDAALTATYYQLYVAPAANPSNPVHVQWYATSELSLLDLTYWVEADIAGTGDFIWRARAWSPSRRMSAWSSPASFTILSIAPSGPVTDAWNASSNRGHLTFTWIHNSRATYYQLYVAPASALGSPILNQWYAVAPSSGTLPTITCSANCSITPHYFTNGNYRWWVRSWAPLAGMSEWVEGLAFTLNLPTPNADNFDHNQFTAFGHTTDEVNFVNPFLEWNDIPNAAWYQVLVRDAANNTVWNEWYRQEDECSGGTCTILVTNDLEDGATYTWFVRAWGPGGMGIGGPSNNGYSAASFFQINLSL